VSEVGNDAFSSGSLIRNEKRIGGWSCTYYFKRWDDEPASARLWIELFDRAEEKSTPAFKAFVQRVRRDSYAEHRFEGVDFTGSLLPGGTIGISMSMAWPNPWVDEGPPYSTSANSFRLRSLPRILAFLRREILSDSAIVGLHVEGAEPVEEMGEEAPNLISGDVRTGPTLIPIEFRTDRVNGGIGPYVEVKIGRSKQGDHSSSQSWEKAFQGVLKPYVLNMAKSDPYDPGRMGTWYEGELGMDAPEEDGHHTVLTVRFPLDFDLEHASLRSLKKIR
jgi:hypothetical protein